MSKQKKNDVQTIYAIEQDWQSKAVELWSAPVEVRTKTVRFLQRTKPHAFGYSSTMMLSKVHFTREAAIEAWHRRLHEKIAYWEEELGRARKKLAAKIVDRTNEGHG